jgi:hypothetical protein
MFRLTSVPRPSGGYVSKWGEYSTPVDAAHAAEAVRTALREGKRTDNQGGPYFYLEDLDAESPFADKGRIYLAGQDAPNARMLDQVVMPDGEVLFVSELHEMLRKARGEQEAVDA